MMIRVGDVDLFYESAGAGPPCVLPHGGPGMGHPGRLAQYAPLEDLVRLVAYDHRGHGRSSRAPETTYTQDQLARDLAGLVRALDLDRPILLGTSAGGFISLLYAGMCPEAVRALILVGTSASRGFMARATANMQRLGTPEMREAYRRLWDGSIGDPEEFRRAFETITPLYYHDRRRGVLAPPADFAAGQHDINAVGPPSTLAGRTFDPVTRRALIRDYARYDARPGLARVRIPTFVAVGRHDWICPVEESEELARLIPGAELHIFEHSGHSPQAEETSAFMKAVRTFLTERVIGAA